MSETKSTLVLETEDKVRRWLTQFFGAFRSGSITAVYRVGSSEVMVDVLPRGDEDVIVKVIALLVKGATASPDLFEFIARENNELLFGRLCATDSAEDGTIDVWFENNVLATYLDPEELRWAVRAGAYSSEEYGSILAERFGGERFYEED